MKISIITVTYNSEKTIEAFLISVLKNINSFSELIIVDNNSSDKTVERILSFKEKTKNSVIKFIKSPENLGFAVGSNIGANLATSNYLFFLNPDTKLYDDSFYQLAFFLEENPKAGLVGPKLITHNKRVQNSVRKLPTIIGAFKEYILNQKNAYSEYAPDKNEPIEVESVYGAAMMVKKELFNKVGKFNEKYFLYFEDLDLCRKIREAELNIYYDPQVEIYHLVGASGTKAEKGSFLAHFIPLRSSGSYYYQVISGNIYHGALNFLFIQIIIFISQKLDIKQK